jgi:diguanylate cyclase (GGDEF)-like protein
MSAMTVPPEPAATPGLARDQAADERDRISFDHDAASAVRDQRAAARDERAETRESDSQPGAGAAHDRSAARRDRQGSARDRQHSGTDREAASSDRRDSARERSAAVFDGLTGARHREPGLVELEREILRAARTGQSFVLAFIDVDGLKRVNDTQGHSAGDDLLRDVADAVRSATRDYDLLVRYGGDEFLCGFLDLPLADAHARFDRSKQTLFAACGGSFSVGLASLREHEELDDLIERADESMYAARRARADAPSGPAASTGTTGEAEPPPVVRSREEWTTGQE